MARVDGLLDGIPLRNAKAELRALQKLKGTRLCEHCGCGFTPKSANPKPGRGRFCGRSCRMKWEHSVKDYSGPNAFAWKGGVSKQFYRYTKRFRAKSPEKHAAQKLVAAAIVSGALVRPSTCSACGADCQPQGHHDNYAEPLSVRWLCRSCHIGHHTAERREAATK